MREETISRRDYLKLASVGALGVSTSGWFDVLASRAAVAAKQGVKHKSCILLWMAGGPAQSHTFDLKGGSEYKPIATTVPGIQVSEHLPRVAKQMKHMTLLRSMSTGDGNHKTATYLMHTGFRKGAGGDGTHPTFGSLVAKEVGSPRFELPNFVAVGTALGPGYLGPRYAPVIVNNFDRGIADATPMTSQGDLSARYSLLEELDKSFMTDYQAPSTNAHLSNYQRALQLIRSPRSNAFNLSTEPANARAAYGKGQFGQGCLLARRLVEAGVPFVEVPLKGWDTHAGAGARVKNLSAELDPAMAALINDLTVRGLINNTLVVWMGEFGRSPGKGSQHYARAWTSVLAGGGIRNGLAFGATGSSGSDVTRRPISAPDFFATLCKALGMDYTKTYALNSSGKPVNKVGRGAKHVREIFYA